MDRPERVGAFLPGFTGFLTFDPSSSEVKVALMHGFLLDPSALGSRERFQDRIPSRFPSDLVPRAQALEESGHNDLALDIIYDEIDDLLRARRFALCASILDEVEPSRSSVDILLALLTATLPAKSELPTRDSFFRRVEHELRRRGEYDIGLLAGLG
jgi:hypothetical protein